MEYYNFGMRIRKHETTKHKTLKQPSTQTTKHKILNTNYVKNKNLT